MIGLNVIKTKLYNQQQYLLSNQSKSRVFDVKSRLFYDSWLQPNLMRPWNFVFWRLLNQRFKEMHKVESNELGLFSTVF